VSEYVSVLEETVEGSIEMMKSALNFTFFVNNKYPYYVLLNSVPIINIVCAIYRFF